MEARKSEGRDTRPGSPPRLGRLALVLLMSLSLGFVAGLASDSETVDDEPPTAGDPRRTDRRTGDSGALAVTAGSGSSSDSRLDLPSRTLRSPSGDANQPGGATSLPPLDGPAIRGVAYDDQGAVTGGAAVRLWVEASGRFVPVDEVETDADGRFAFARTPTRARLRIDALADELVFGPEVLEVSSRSRTVRLDAIPARRIRVDVRDPYGDRLDEAEVQVSGVFEESVLLNWSRDDDSVQVPAGHRLGFVARATIGNATVISARTLLRPEDDGPVSLVLHPPQRLVGSVRSEHVLVEGLKVRLRPIDASRPTGYGRGRRDATVESGRFELEDLDPGDYELAVLPGRVHDQRTLTPVHSEQVFVREHGITRLSIEVGLPDPAEFLLVACTDSSGKSLEACRFAVEPTRPEPNGVLQAVRGINTVPLWDLGVAVTRRSLFGAQLENPTALLRVDHRYYGSLVEAVPATANAVLLRFGTNATLTVRADPGASAAAYEGVNLQIRITPESRQLTRKFHLGGGRLQMIDDPSGTLVPGLRSGRYRLALFMNRDEAPHFWLFLTDRVLELGPGANEIAFALPPLQSLSVRSRTLGEGSLLRLQGPWIDDRRDTRSETIVQLGPSGEAVFPPVPPGRYTLSAQQSTADGPLSLQLPSNPVDYSPRRFDCLIVRSHVTGGPLHDDGVLAEDRITAIDGRTIRELGPREAHELLMQPTERTLTVARGERELEIRTTHGSLLIHSARWGVR